MTSVPNGTINVTSVPLIDPEYAPQLKLSMSHAVPGGILVTVTWYTLVVRSCAVTVYGTGTVAELLKSTVLPEAGPTVAKGDTVQVGLRVVRFVPYGTTRVTLVPLMTPTLPPQSNDSRSQAGLATAVVNCHTAPLPMVLPSTSSMRQKYVRTGSSRPVICHEVLDVRPR